MQYILTSALVNISMNNAKLNVYKKVLQEVWENFVGAEEFIKRKIEEICCNEKLSVEEVTYFVVSHWLALKKNRLFVIK